jgi:hypothetical protein
MRGLTNIADINHCLGIPGHNRPTIQLTLCREPRLPLRSSRQVFPSAWPLTDSVARRVECGHAHPGGFGCCCRFRGHVRIRHHGAGASHRALRHRRLRSPSNVDRDRGRNGGAARAAIDKATPCQREAQTSREKKTIMAIARKTRDAKKTEAGEIVELRSSDRRECSKHWPNSPSCRRARGHRRQAIRTAGRQPCSSQTPNRSRSCCAPASTTTR